MTDEDRGPVENIRTELRRFELFHDLDDAALEEVASHCRVTRFGIGQAVIHQKDASNEVHFVFRGRLWATLYSAGGREVAYEELQAGTMVGEIAAIDAGPRTAHVIAVEPAVTAVLPRGEFLRLLRNHPSLALATLRRLASTVRHLADRVYEFSTLPVRGRLLAEILRLARDGRSNQGTVTIDDFPTHSQLASRISTHREAVSRELAALARRKLITQTGRTLVIHDLAAIGQRLRSMEQGEV